MAKRSQKRRKKTPSQPRDQISIISHQLGNSLAIAQWNVELLVSEDVEPLSPVLRGMLSQTSDALTVLGQAINTLLLAMNIEQKTLPLYFEEVAVTSMILSPTLQTYEPYVREKKITVSTTFEFEGKMWLDMEKIRILFRLLLDNAIAYSMPHSRLHIHTTLRRVDSGDECVVTVEDEGIGIAREEQELIFSKFYRGTLAQRLSPNGLGLGLYVARAIVEGHGGTIWIGKKRTKGTLMQFSLPVGSGRPIGPFASLSKKNMI